MPGRQAGRAGGEVLDFEAPQKIPAPHTLALPVLPASGGCGQVPHQPT